MQGNSYKPPAETLETVTAKHAYLISKIEQYDKILDEFESLKKIFEEILKKAGSIFLEQNEIKENTLVQNSNIDMIIKLLSSESDRSKVREGVLEQMINYDKKLLDQYRDESGQALDSIYIKLTSYIDKYLKIEDFDLSKNYLKKEIENLKLENEKVTHRMKLVEERVQSHDPIHVEIREELGMQRKDSLRISDEILSLDFRIQKKIQEIIERMNNEKHADDESFSTLMGLMHAEIKERCPEVSVTQISQCIENLEIDVSNATLKSNNTAHQVFLLEKKIENISLHLKKLELEA